jgi:hypothetical protein
MMTLAIEASPGQPYFIEYVDALSSNPSWQTLTSGTVPPAGVAMYQEPATNSQRLFRLVYPKPQQ